MNFSGENAPQTGFTNLCILMGSTILSKKAIACYKILIELLGNKNSNYLKIYYINFSSVQDKKIKTSCNIYQYRERKLSELLLLQYF